MAAKRTKQGGASVLKKQRVRSRLPRSTVLARAAAAVAGVAAVCAVGYGVAQGYRHWTHGPGRAAADWQISLKLEAPLSDAAQEQVLKTARRLIGSGSRDELAVVATEVQKLGAYADVRVVSLAPKQVAISVRERQPALCIEADRVRYVSRQGDVYGEVPATERASCPGPILTGLFPTGAHVSIGSDLTVVLSQEERAITTEAVALWAEAQAKGLRFTQLDVRKYRGFFAVLAPTGTELGLGRAPFAGKLQKLQGILERLEQRHEIAARVELDYQGKAFIKLKKM